MRRWAAAVLLVVTAVPLAADTDAPLGVDQVRAAAREFGDALLQADIAALRRALPRRGKVQMHLVCFGPEEGSFSAGQVEALLKDFLRQGAVHSFELLRADCADERYAVVRARAAVTDRSGGPGEVHLHLSFEPEDGRWVLREFRETPP